MSFRRIPTLHLKTGVKRKSKRKPLIAHGETKWASFNPQNRKYNIKRKMILVHSIPQMKEGKVRKTRKKTIN